MIPAYLNLLSPSKRRIAQRLIYAQFARNMIDIGVFLVSFIGIILLGGFLVLQNHLTMLLENLASVSHHQAIKNKDIKTTNDILHQTDALQKTYTQWSAVLPAIISAIPDGVILSELLLDAPGHAYIFTGVARTRNDLLLFQENLQSLPNVTGAVVPMSQLTDRENIAFSITATLAP